MNITTVWTRTVVVSCLYITLSGCATKNIMTHPDMAGKSRTIKTVAFAEPEIKVYEISAGGVPELMDDWSAKGKENVTKAMMTAFKGTPVKITAFKPDDATEAELKQVMALFETVMYSMKNQAFINPQNPDFSVGSLETILNSSGGDALLLVHGVDQIATAGKKALNVLGTITGVAVGALTGVNTSPRMEGTAMRMVLADRQGTILWYNTYNGTYDLRDPDSSDTLVKNTLDSFPGFGK